MRRPRARRAAALAGALLLAIPAGAAPYAIDPTHTHALAEVDHFGTSTLRVRFGPIDGDVEYDRASGRGSVALRIDVRRFASGVPTLDARLRERDMLATEAHPEAFFVADRFAPAAGGELRGEFTFRGVSRPLALRVLRFQCRLHPLFRREVCGGDFEGEFRRSEHGFDYGLPLVGDRVRLLVTVEAIAR